MFHLLKIIIWLTGAVVIALYAIRYFGYEVNRSYWEEQKAACLEMTNECRDTLIRKGTDGAKEECRWNCVNLKELIVKTEEQQEEEDEESEVIE